MKLRTRLAISTGLVTLAVAASVGGYALSVSVRTQIERIDKTLARNVSFIQKDTKTPLAEALLLAKQDPSVAVVAIVDADKKLTVLSGSQSLLPQSVPLTLLKSGAKETEPLYQQEVRIRTVPLRDQEFIIIGASVSDVNAFRVRNTQLLVQFSLLAALLGGAVIVIVTRLDLRRVERLIQSASAVAQGESVRIPEGNGSSEVAELSRALERMVATLQANAASEREMRVRMEEFLADASHELRTPLTVISGYLQLLQSQAEPGPDQRARALARMAHEAHRMSELVANLLLLAEVGSVANPQFEEFDLSQLLVSAVEDLRALNPGRAIDAMLAPRVVLPAVPAHMQQLVANIASNIERHTPSDAAVRVRLWCEAGSAHLRVEDGGPGFPALSSGEASVVATREFTRFDPSRSRETGGSGLGMSIMSAIVEEHHGSMALLTSDLGGLRLDISLPLTRS